MKKESEHSSSKSTMEELYKIRKNYGIYIGKGWRDNLYLLFFLLDHTNKKSDVALKLTPTIRLFIIVIHI